MSQTQALPRWTEAAAFIRNDTTLKLPTRLVKAGAVSEEAQPWVHVVRAILERPSFTVNLHPRPNKPSPFRPQASGLRSYH